MSLERDPKIKTLWKARIYPNGRRKDPTTGKASNKRETYWFEGDEAAARNWYVNLVRSGPRKAPPIAPTLEQAYPDFCVHYRTEASAGTYKDFLLTWERHLKRYFGPFKPQLLTPALFDAYKDRRSQQHYLPGKPLQKPEDDTAEESARRRPPSKRTVQKEITYIQSMLKWMIANNRCLPLTWRINNYKASQTTSPEKIIPSRRDMVLLLRACKGADRIYRPIFATAYYSGLRRTELLTLDGRRIDLRSWYILIRGKGEKNRTVPIVTKLKPYIRSAHQSGRLFTNPETGKAWHDLKKVMKRACKTVGIPAISLHTFRHAFAVHALQRGVSLRTLQLVMGHSTIKTTERYLHLVPEQLASDLDRKVKVSAPRQAGRKTSRDAALT
ncbi:MAG: hypothetical protein FDZ69_07615 [Deltaproteobacteria bacterium]|nr:MAG: hypothetical protein FDZ69_07615 [Deltaproteobacteria bacterium]